jgi:preprotein translocase subunit SecE
LYLQICGRAEKKPRRTDQECCIMAELNPAKFIREVRSEVSKVTWPTRKETMVSTVMVLVLALISALFFLAVDAIFASLVTWILGWGK